MKKIFSLAIITIALVMASCCKQKCETTEEKVEGEAMPEIAALRIAGDLAKYGQETNSPLALIEAADILVSTPTQDLDAEVELGEEVENEAEKTKIALEAPALLELAKELALEDEHLLALIAEVEAKIEAQAEGTRGAAGGPKRGCATVYAGQSDYYTERFVAGTFCEVAVVGDGDTDLDLYVYDSNGNLIVSDVSYSDRCYVAFYPYVTTNFRIKVLNRGRVYNNYCIATN